MILNDFINFTNLSRYDQKIKNWVKSLRASSSQDGLLSKEDFAKLQHIENVILNVQSFYLGPGDSWEDVLQEEYYYSQQENSYSLTTNDDNIILLYPTASNVTLTMSGVEVPLSTPVQVEYNNITYYYVKSSITYKGNLPIKIFFSHV